MEISPDKVIVGQRFDLTIFADFSAYRNVTIIEPPLPDGISLVSGPYKSAQTIRVGDVSNPEYIKKTRVFYKYKVTKPGLFTIGSFSLSDGENQFRTEPLMFPALAYDERELNYPIFARWGSIPDKIFVGETIPLILEMENLEELSFPEQISMNSPSGGMFEKVDSVGEISVTTIGEHEVYIAPIESWLFTPTVSGTINIPSASVLYGNIKRSTGLQKVDVQEIPAKIESSGAIGNFTVSTAVENLPVKKGSPLTLRVKVEGDGNLNYMRMPQPEFSGLSVIDKEELYNIYPSLSGYSGYREDIYRLSVGGNEETLSVLFDDWSWYNRKSESIETKRMDDYYFENQISGVEETFISLREQYPLLSSEKILKYRAPVYNVSWYYLLLLPGVISVIAAFIRKRHDMKILGLSIIFLLCSSSAIETFGGMKELLDDAATFAEKGETIDALDLYRSLISSFGDNPSVYYNMALLSYDIEQNDQVIFNLRKALSLKPGDRLFTKTLTSVEEEFELDHQISASTGLSPDLFFLFFVLLFNLGAFLIVLNINKKKMEFSILIVMVYFIALTTGFVVFYTDYVAQRETAVVIHEGGHLKKVPDIGGGDWLTLLEGTAVYIKSESDNFLLIQTGYGLEGWLDKDSLLKIHGDL
jgi:tetratricopeptide (TPR) repeat protein